MREKTPRPGPRREAAPTKNVKPLGLLQAMHVLMAFVALFSSFAVAQQTEKDSSTNKSSNKQINVNWLYGSYIPKDVPRRSLNNHERFKLYIRQTYTTPGIYVKTALFAGRDQIADSTPEWGQGFPGFAKRLGDRQAQFIIQNSVSSLGDALVGWEPRYDRCQCAGFWPRTGHAVLRNFVTYDRSEKSLRPQIMPFLGAFGAAAVATTWKPGNPAWQVKGYQAAITQIFIGSAVNWVGEFAPEIFGKFQRKKKQSNKADKGH